MASLIAACCCPPPVHCVCGEAAGDEGIAVRDALPSSVNVTVTINICLSPYDGSNNTTATISGAATRDPLSCTFLLAFDQGDYDSNCVGLPTYVEIAPNINGLSCAYGMVIDPPAPGCLAKPPTCSITATWNASKPDGTGMDPLGTYTSTVGGQVVSAVVS